MPGPVRAPTLISLPSLLLSGAMVSALCVTASAADPQVGRGKYLTSVIPCTDSPYRLGLLLGKADDSETRYFGGSDVGFEVPGLWQFSTVPELC